MTIVKAAILAAAALAIALLLVPSRTGPGTLVWNFTPSVPIGLYRIDAAPWSPGDRVAVRPSGRLADILAQARVLKPDRLLLKRVAGAEDDVVCRNGGNVSVNGKLVARAKINDSGGAQLPSWAGCSRLGPRQVLLLGEVTESFDGRYFGPTEAADIVGRISPVIVLP